MCFALYIASSIPLPIIPWDEKSRALHTEPIGDNDRKVMQHFKHSHIYFVGSDTYCGCGYRHATYQTGTWPEEEWQPEEDQGKGQANHEQLVDFVRKFCAEDTGIELYGMWEGDIDEPACSHQDITPDRLSAMDFHFRERGHYTISFS